ncbi:PAS domain-containing protein [bacterium]|nr:PAS domain-containing protein [bacterium]
MLAVDDMMKDGTFHLALFEALPVSVAVVDREWHVIAANKAFEETFGYWKGRTCHEAFKSNPARCKNCEARAVFEDGRIRVGDHQGLDRFGRACDYAVHFAPLRDEKGEVTHILEVASDVTETKRWKAEYDRLFDNVPCTISILDRDLRVVRANRSLEETYGRAKGHPCFKVYKGRTTPCENCPAMQTFKDGLEHLSRQSGRTPDGEETHYIVSTSPFTWDSDGVDQVIEISTDVTQLHVLEVELREAHELYQSLISNARDGILAVDTEGSVRILNDAAKRLIGWDRPDPPDPMTLRMMLPGDFFLPRGEMEQRPDYEFRIPAQEEGEGVDASGEIPVLFRAIELEGERHSLGRAAFLQDLSALRTLEREKLDNERLAAVGQTVAGLAHTIKNLLMGLEGGMYMVDSGLQRGDADRLSQGWEMLQRNFEKTSSMVRDFLSFAKGRVPKLVHTDPLKLIHEVVQLYRDTAKRLGVTLKVEEGKTLFDAPLDRDGIEACLTNLISNAIDAVTLEQEGGGEVSVRAYDDESNSLVFEVQDNGIGMESEVARQVFTTFFTTKGGKGTGLGLLTTRKIVQEHGGTIELDSEPGVGSTFRICLPRERLEAIASEQAKRDKKAETYSSGGRT